MKKNVIALLLSLVLAAGSIGATPVFAAETTAEEAVAVEEEASEESEDADTGLTTSGVFEEETIQVEEEEPVEKEKEAEEPVEEQGKSADIVVPEETADDEETKDHGDEGETSAKETENEKPTVIEEETRSEEDNEAVQAGDVVDSGTCGENATWTLTGTGDNLTLTISGRGKMEYFSENDTPWTSRRTKIRTVVIEDGITYVGDYAFYSLNKLTNVMLPETVTEIGGGAFNNCVSLRKIYFPDSLIEVSTIAFDGCSNLKEIHINSLESWLNLEWDEFDIPFNLYLKDTLLTEAVIPDGFVRIKDYAFYGCSGLKSVTIPDTVTSIGNSAFEGCTNLTNISIPDSVTTMGFNVFCECSSLKSIAIPDSVMEIGSAMFSDCTSLTSVKLGNNIQTISGQMFRFCNSLKSIDIPDSVTEIGRLAFDDCSSLKCITIPDSVVSIGDYAFDFWKERSLAVRFRGTKAQWDSAVGNNDVYYSSIIYNCFSVPATFKLSGTSFVYTGKAFKPTVTVTYKGKKLLEGTDYKLVYKNNINTGIATANVVGIGKYSGTEPLEYRIQPGATKKVTCTNVASGMKVSWEKVPGATRYNVYRNGELIKTTSVLAITDQQVKYWRGEKFTYKVVALGKDARESTLSRTATYYRLMPVGIKSLTNPSAGKMTVKYQFTSGGSGYVVRYGLKSDMSDANVVTVKGEDTTERTFGGMQRGKTYYVQVRTYKIDNGVRYYSGYCTTKTITIKK